MLGLGETIVNTGIELIDLFVAGIIPLHDAVQAMVLWFLGDLFGVTSIVPGLMLLFAHFDEAQPMQRKRDRARASEHAAWVIALCLSLSFVFVIGRGRRRRSRTGHSIQQQQGKSKPGNTQRQGSHPQQM